MAAFALAACSGQPANEAAPDDAAVANDTAMAEGNAAPNNAAMPAEGGVERAADSSAAAAHPITTPPAGRFQPWQSAALLSAKGISEPTAVRGQRVPIAFGTARAAVEAAVTRGSGVAVASRSTNSECGAGPIAMTHYAGGLALHFQDEKFVGWSLQGDTGPRWGVADNALGIGSVKSTIRDAKFTRSTLGDEFVAHGVSGIVEDSRVVALWGGISCNFR